MGPEQVPQMLLAAVVLVVLALAGSKTLADSDLWGHVRFGLDILEARAIPERDSYSFTSDRLWINHEWLSETIMAAAYQLGGGAGLIALKWLLTIATFGMLWFATREADVHPPLAAGLVLWGIIGTLGLTITIRPQLFSMLLYTALLALLNRSRRRPLWSWLWMPPLFACWANLHGGWIVGLAVLALWSAGAVLSRSVPWQWAAGATLSSLAATLANPYGDGLWWFLWQTVGIGRADITEWQPVTRSYALTVVWIATVGLVMAASWLRGREAARLIVPPAMLGLLALRVLRLEGFFVLTSVTLLAPCFAKLGPASLPVSKRPTRADLAVVLALCLVGFTVVSLAVRHRAQCLWVTGPDYGEALAPEAEAILFLRDNPIHGRLLTYFDYGQLAIWHLAPDLLVSYDGRRETVYSERVRNDHLRFYRSADDASYANTLRADYIWLPHRLPVIRPLLRDGWLEIFRGPTSVILAREPGFYRTPEPWLGARCFPGP